MSGSSTYATLFTMLSNGFCAMCYACWMAARAPTSLCHRDRLASDRSFRRSALHFAGANPAQAKVSEWIEHREKTPFYTVWMVSMSSRGFCSRDWVPSALSFAVPQVFYLGVEVLPMALVTGLFMHLERDTCACKRARVCSTLTLFRAVA